MSLTTKDHALLARVYESGELPAYQLADTQVQMGSSFGNAKCWLDTLGTGAVERLFSVDICQTVVCATALRYSKEGQPSRTSGLSDAHRPARVLLEPQETGRFRLHPESQQHCFDLPASLAVEETIFVPKTGDAAERPVVYLRSRVTNRADHPQQLRVSAFADLHGTTPPDLEARFDPALNALVAWNAGQPDWVRVFGATHPLVASGATHDRSAVSEPEQLVCSTMPADPKGDLIGTLHVDLDLPAGGMREVIFILAFSHQGQEAAVASFRDAEPVAELRATQRHLRDRLSYAKIVTPDPVINDGMYWAKVNMLRVMADYPQGPAFTNSPGNSDHVVVRDSCWFVLGCDYLLPSFCRALLDQIATRQEPDGMIIEYWNALSGETEDYGLSMNDNTPLFLIALDHHWRVSGDRAWLGEMYERAACSARYIIDQEDDRGLVFVKADGLGPRGIASWRNIIPNHQINGAVTEVNAECVAALRAVAEMAAVLGRDEADEFRQEADKLKDAINRHLLNPENGLYYLNIDMAGRPHTDVTVDQVFPVMFDVAPEDVAYRIVNRLTAPDFSNEAGIRTVPRTSLRYHPYRDDGLLGGIWPGVTWWCAYASARYYSAFHVNALRASYEAYNRDPRKNDTVPGQFSEWFDGESMVNLGMRLSPWEPPRFAWAAVEGVCGIKETANGLEVNPLMPSDWLWTAVRTLPFHGSTASIFIARQRDHVQLYSDHKLVTQHHLEVYDEDATGRVHTDNAASHVIAFRRPGELIVCVGNENRRPTAIVLELQELLVEQRYSVNVFNSRDRTWTSSRIETADKLGTLTISVDEGGYGVVRLRAVADGNVA